MKYYIGQIWWGYLEFPVDYYREDTKKFRAGTQKLRTFAIVKINKYDTGRVVDGSWTVKDKYSFF
ncbi:hypothetical protein [Spiroplasma apis]|uniref:Uncharacterized protein n=1 Tax=Spiroplasma apis B31 TaxID=1276258 RepID=V5RKI7_SPIAP|nr:hypothetical protein [Spiroplasma apis]AHB36616.1 hypothetical protein SAPIS_v1c07710 [Spiroplasma apis B31]